MMEIPEALILSVGTGVVSAFTTVITLKVDINWIKREIERLELALVRAHERIDSLEK